jgi:hypothetical protein
LQQDQAIEEVSPSVIGAEPITDESVELFVPAKERLPSYSKIRRVLLNVVDEQYSVCLINPDVSD